VNLEFRDLHGSSSELPLGFALRAHTSPEVYSHCRAFLFWFTGGILTACRRPIGT